MSANTERPSDPGNPENSSRSHARGQGSTPQRYHGSKAWWSVGELLHQGITHQSVGLTLGQTDDDSWDVNDSLADLYQAVTQRQKQAASKAHRSHHSRKGSAGTAGRVDSEKRLDIQRWLDDDTSHGFIRVFASDSDSQSRLFPCTLSTHAQKICLQLGIPGNALHVQLSGHVIKRMEPFDCPLAIQNEYLSGLGYSDVRYIQQEGPNEDLTYLVRFYAGKPLSDYTYTRNQLTTYAYVRKGKLLHQWARRMCVISGTTLLIYRDKETEPTSVQLAKGSVEEVQVKGQSLVLKVTSTLEGERSIFMSFVSQDDYSKWLKKLRKATAKLPSKADLSNCHLEFLPETVFINTELQILTLRHNALRERPIEEDIYTIGWLDDLPRFTMLRSLNLADNQLNSFPVSLCSIRSLVELNLASNRLMEIPSQISELHGLQVLHLHNNLLSSLPEEIATMSRLTVIVLAFNRFVSIPPILTHAVNKSSKLDSIIMAGNQLTRIPADHLVHMTHIKKIDLRLNRLQLLPTETAKFQNLEHITHLDIRENEVVDLDIRAIRCLEYINCERNNMRSMQVNGSALKNLFASRNALQTLSISPKPEWLISMDVSQNKLSELPDWLSDCFFLVHLDVSHNQLKALPERLLRDAPKLKIVKANHNRMTSLPSHIRSEHLEELHLQHNQLRHLPSELFVKAKRLRYLNVTRNKLCDLPPPNDNDSFNKLQELYLSFNHLGNAALHKICCFPRLRVLHLARNKLSVIAEIDLEKLEQLTEINVSSNNLTYLPSSLGRHPKLQILRTNCNLLQELPNFKNSSALKVLEASSNLLVNVNMANLMASQVSLLDISANPNILVKAQEIQAARNSKQLCMVDMRGQNRSLEDIRSEKEDRLKGLWQTGLSQSSGIRNKLCVSTLSKPQFGEKGEGLFGIFDGGRNDLVAETLCDVMPTVLKEERVRSKRPEVYLKYSMLSAHRNLKSHGQKLGASSVVAFLHMDDKGQHVLSIANVGDGQAVLCRNKKAVVLSRNFVTSEDREDTARVINAGGIITEDGRVSGVTYNTRLLGSSYLYPCVVPDPHLSSTVLTHQDTFFILGSQGLWQYVSHEEAVKEIKDVADPIIAAKRLQDLAQGLGSRENMAVLVVRLTLSHDEKTKMADLIRHQKSAQKELFKILSHETQLLHHLRDGVPKDAKIDDIVIDRSGHAKKHKTSRKRLSEASSSEKSLPNREEQQQQQQRQRFDAKHENQRREALKELQKATFNYIPNDTSNSEYDSTMEKEKEKNWKDKHLYRKKADDVTELQRRIAKDLKANELRNMFEKELKASNSLIGGLDYKEEGDEGGDDDGDDDIFVTEENTVNWSAVRAKRVKGENPESQLKQRISHEIIEKELKTVVDEAPNFSETEEDARNNDNNWLTVSNKKEFHSPKLKRSHGHGVGLSTPANTTRGITLPTEAKPGQGHDPATPVDLITSSDSKLSLHSDILNMMSKSSHSKLEPPDQFADTFDPPLPEVEGYDLSPGESVSSIDLRLHDEVEEIYRLRHVPNPSFQYTQHHYDNSNHHHDSGVLPPLDKSLVDSSPFPPRSLSPDSLISLDDYVKPPISNANIDRDALLFHQMQMARAQAHAGSSTSLDTVQSAPLNPPSKDLQTNVRASSHSIEVLVNIGLDKDETVKQGSLPLSLEHVNRSAINGSTSTLTSKEDVRVESAHKLDSEKQLFGSKKKLRSFNSIGNLNATVISVGKTRGDGEDPGDDNDDEDSDRDTIVGDASDIANGDNNDDNYFVQNGNDGNKSYSVENSGEKNDDGGDVNDNNNNDGDDEDYSDSEGSIGNVSLEDGYSAFDFDKLDKSTTLSMTNMLADYDDIYPKTLVMGGNSEGQKKEEVTSRNEIAGQDLDVDTKRNSSIRFSIGINDDYDDIGDPESVDDVGKGDGERLSDQKTTNNFTYEDDINPYEDIHVKSDDTATGFSLGRLLNGENLLPVVEECEFEPSSPPPGPDVSAEEENIDSLYARVNKIKMKKILDQEAEEEGRGRNNSPPLDPLLPGIVSISYPPSNQPSISFGDDDDDDDDDNNSNNDDDDDNDHRSYHDDEEKEIFITATDILNRRSPHIDDNANNRTASNSSPPPPPLPPNTNMSFLDPYTAKNTSPPPPPTSSSTSPSSSSSAATSPTPTNTSSPHSSKLKSRSAAPPPPIPPFNQSHPLTNGHRDTHHSPRPPITNDSHNTTTTTAINITNNSSNLHNKNPRGQNNSPHGQNSNQHGQNSKQHGQNKSNPQQLSRPLPPPLPRPPYPINRAMSPPPRPPIPPRHPLSPRPSPTTSTTTATPPSSSSSPSKATTPRPIPIPINMQPASRQLPTQRSIIITYL